jgi:hypothetical protein
MDADEAHDRVGTTFAALKVSATASRRRRGASDPESAQAKAG